MTVSTELNKVLYNALTGQDTFAYNFRVDLKTDMNVYLAGVIISQNDWTITGLGNASGGNVILNTPLIEDLSLTLIRELPLTQLVDYQPFDAFPAETHESALDRLTMITQQLTELIDRNPVPPPDVGPGDSVIPGNLTVNGTSNLVQGAFSAAPITIGTQLVNRDYTEGRYTKKAGDTLTGQLKGITPVNVEDLTRKDYVDNIAIRFAGSVNAFAAPPAGVGSTWLYCNGQSFAQAAHPALFAVIGVIYGGDATTFLVPDYRGRFLRGQDDGAGIDPEAAGRSPRGDGDGGDLVGTIQDDELRSHTHLQETYRVFNTRQSGGSTLYWQDAVDRPTQATGGTETRPLNIYTRYYIHTGRSV